MGDRNTKLCRKLARHVAALENSSDPGHFRSLVTYFARQFNGAPKTMKGRLRGRIRQRIYLIQRELAQRQIKL